VLFSSHILQEVEALCDRVIIINKGKIVADDKIGSLQKAGMDSHFVQVQFKESIDKNLLNSIREIIRTDELAANNFRFHTPNPESVRKELMELSLRHNLNIVSLQTGEQSLEEIFRGLTSTYQPNN
jgi:ABC-2 type transport system ATP-binding protein